MGDSGSDIIIKGGSVELTYDPTTYTTDPGIDPKTWKNSNKKMIQILITDDNDETVYDSGEQQQGLKYTIRARCR